MSADHSTVEIDHERFYLCDMGEMADAFTVCGRCLDESGRDPEDYDELPPVPESALTDGHARECLTCDRDSQQIRGQCAGSENVEQGEAVPESTPSEASNLDPHPMLADLDEDAQVVFEPADGEPQLGVVHKISHGGTPPGEFCRVEIVSSGDVWDLESQYDPRSGWNGLEAFIRGCTDRHEKGVVESIETVKLGVDPRRLEIGHDVRRWDGERFRIVRPPSEREHSNMALALPLDNPSKLCVDLDPAKIRPESVPDGEPDGSDERGFEPATSLVDQNGGAGGQARGQDGGEF